MYFGLWGIPFTGEGYQIFAILSKSLLNLSSWWVLAIKKMQLLAVSSFF